jgi:uncharacterized membrane protein
MKKIINIITSGFVGFWIPIIIIMVLLAKMFNVIHHLILPLEAHLPPLKLFGVTTLVIVVVIVMIILCYLGGLMLKLNWVKKKTREIERSILDRIPGYSTFKDMIDRESEIENDHTWNAVLVEEDDHHYLLGYTSYSSEHYYMVHKVTTNSLADTEMMIVPKNKVIMLSITSPEFIQHVKRVKNTAELVERVVGSKASQDENGSGANIDFDKKEIL